MLLGFVIFLSAFLLFQMQLVVAKHLLPWFGGTPAVWTTSQMFFQVLLLGGYAYAHRLGKVSRVSTQPRIHVALLLSSLVAVLALLAWGGAPLLAPESMKPTEANNPVWLLLTILASTVAVPFFALSTTGPLLQRWHSHQEATVQKTYRLYGLSNAGSLLGLVSYPLGIERALDLPSQAWLWAGGFALFIVGGVIICRQTSALGNDQSRDQGVDRDTPAEGDERPGWSRMMLWLFLSGAGSVLFLATTNQLSQDVAAVPLLWALPLAIYLLTFIICFDRPQWYSRRWTVLAAAVASLAITPAIVDDLSVPAQIAGYSALVFSMCMLCHGELVRLRPGARHLTLFYLLVALGGALGGTFASIAAPVFFRGVWELQWGVVAGWLLVMAAWSLDRESPVHSGDRWLFVGLIAIACFLSLSYVLESPIVARIDWLSSQGGIATFVGTAVVTISVGAIARTQRIALSPHWPKALLLFLIVSSCVFAVQSMWRTTRTGTLFADRNFYGSIRVVSIPVAGGDARQLDHGTTLHGVQVNTRRYYKTPTAYYSPGSGISVAARLIRSEVPSTAGHSDGVHFGVLGMGVGTISAFAGRGDRVRYYEINPEVIDLSRGLDPYFTFVEDSAAKTDIVEGDARLILERELVDQQPQQFDLLAIDAFSGDSVPIHLTTLEAFRVYARHLRNDDSILAVNVTNRYVDLEPVIAANARALGFYGVRVDNLGEVPAPVASSWILLTRNRRVLDHPELQRAGVRPLRNRHILFTDKYSNLLRVLY